MCTGFAACVHLARARGCLDVFPEVDSLSGDALSNIIGLDKRGMQFARLPFRLGGLGIRSIAAHASSAFMAAAIETHELLRVFSKRASNTRALPADPLVTAVWSSVPVAVQAFIVSKASPSFVQQYNLPVSPQSVMPPPPPQKTIAATSIEVPNKLQREFSHVLDNTEIESMYLTTEEKVRVKSCGARGASLYLVGPITYDEQLPLFFLPSSTFCFALKLRLGLETRHDLAEACRLCSKDHSVDDGSNRAINCMTCGRRTRAHNAVRDRLADILRVSLLSPSVEPWIDKRAGCRADINISMGGYTWVIDVAITNALNADHRHKASITAGGAATDYEGVKRKKYEGHLSSGQILCPFVYDHFGAPGASAQDCLRKIVPHFKTRLGITHAVASRIIYGRISICVIRAIASIAELG